MEIFVSYRRVPYDGDYLLAVCSTEQLAEEAIARHVCDVLEERRMTVDEFDELMYSLSSDWIIQRRVLDGKIIDEFKMDINVLKDLCITI